MRSAVVALITLLCAQHVMSLPLYAQQPNSSQSEAAIPGLPPASTSTDLHGQAVLLLERQVEVLEREVELHREYRSDLLATIYWSLGGVVAFTLILVTYGWFSNFRMYERDKEALRSEVTTAARAEISGASQALSAALLTERKRVDDAIEALRTELRERIAQTTNDERTSSQTAQQQALQQITKRHDELEKRVAQGDVRVEFKVDRLERELYEREGNHDLVITQAIAELESALKLDWDFAVEAALDALTAAANKGGRFTKMELERASASLKRLPDSLSTQKEVLQKLLQTAKTMP